MTWTFTKDNLRTLMAFAGGVLVMSGDWSLTDLSVLMDEIKTIAGALTTLGAFGWGLMDKPSKETPSDTATEDSA